MTRVDLIAEFNKGKGKFVNSKDGFSTLIECSKVHRADIDVNHGHKQAKKPKLPGIFVSHYTGKGDLVCDFFGGSGSTMVAAHQLERRCFMMELEPENCQVIVDRMKALDGTLQIKK